MQRLQQHTNLYYDIWNPATCIDADRATGSEPVEETEDQEIVDLQFYTVEDVQEEDQVPQYQEVAQDLFVINVLV